MDMSTVSFGELHLNFAAKVAGDVRPISLYLRTIETVCVNGPSLEPIHRTATLRCVVVEPHRAHAPEGKNVGIPVINPRPLVGLCDGEL